MIREFVKRGVQVSGKVSGTSMVNIHCSISLVNFCAKLTTAGTPPP